MMMWHAVERALEKVRARLAGLRAAPAPLTPPLFISCSDIVHQSYFSLSFPLSLTAPEPEKLVFFSSGSSSCALQLHYSVGARAGGSPAKRALRVFLVLDGARASKARGGQIRFRAYHPFCSCGFFARMMTHRLFTSPPLSANMRVAVCVQNSRCTVPTESTGKEFPFDFYRRPENDLSVTTVSANLGGRVSMREREMPFIPRHSHPETSHQAAAIQPPFTASRTIM